MRVRLIGLERPVGQIGSTAPETANPRLDQSSLGLTVCSCHILLGRVRLRGAHWVAPMSLTVQQIAALTKAVKDYDYPRALFDFRSHEEMCFPTMRELEGNVHSCLLSEDLARVKDGLSNILYWGNVRAGYCWHRVGKFRDQVDFGQLREARDVFSEITGPGLRRLKTLGLPGFSNMSFLSKLRMFLNPRRYVALDLKLTELSAVGSKNPLSAVKRQKTYIPVSRSNELVYEGWCAWCQRIAGTHFCGGEVYAADIERAVFWLADCGALDQAAAILADA